MSVYRTEHALALYGVEAAWGNRVVPVKRFGIHETVTAPDMENEYYPFFGVGSGRSRDDILRGRLSFKGSVPDIRIQGDTDIKALFALMLGRVDGVTVIEGVTAGDERVPSMTMQLAFRDTNGNYSFIREFYGGKVARGTIRANEGEELRVSLDDIIFKDMAHNQAGVAKYNADVSLGADPGPSAQPRFMFAGATISMLGMPVAKCRSFALTVDNQLEPKYYLSKTGDAANLTQVINDLVEGRRVYSLQLAVDWGDPLTDMELFDFMMNQSAATAIGPTIGTVVTAQFQLSEGAAGILTIQCGGVCSQLHPGTVIKSGKISIPAPPTGYFPTQWIMDVDHVGITTMF